VASFSDEQFQAVDLAVASSRSSLAELQRKLQGLSQAAEALRAQREAIEDAGEDAIEMQTHIRDTDLHLGEALAIIDRLGARPFSPNPHAMKRSLRQIGDANAQIDLAAEALERAEQMRPQAGSPTL
jgi:hypothetical protein